MPHKANHDSFNAQGVAVLDATQAEWEPYPSRGQGNGEVDSLASVVPGVPSTPCDGEATYNPSVSAEDWRLNIMHNQPQQDATGEQYTQVVGNQEAYRKCDGKV